MTLYISSVMLGAGIAMAIAMAFVTGFLVGLGGATRRYRASVAELSAAFEKQLREFQAQQKEQLRELEREWLGR
jgi:predicted HicB family RNase H-like nuclease